jgi:membrane protease subunit HflK
MPWNNEGGGPWGSPGGGGQNPWGRGGGGGGGGSPDFEDMIRRGQDRFRRMMPKGLGGGRGIILIVAAVLVLWAITGFYRVEPNQQGVVLRFGEYVRTTPPGLHYRLPWPIETVRVPSVTRIRRIDIGFASAGDGRTQMRRDIPEESLMLTGDANVIDIDFTVLWRIENARNFLFNIRDPEETVKFGAESAMREVMGRTDIQPALTEARPIIEQDVRDLLQGILNNYGAGITITEVQLQDVQAPSEVRDAFDDVQRARQDQQRLRNQAEAYRNDIIPRARGDAVRTVQEARAYREEVINRAQGDAQRFLSILLTYSTNPDVTAQRLYLETIEEVFAGIDKVIIEENGEGNGQGVVPYLPLNELRRQTGTQAEGQ